MPDRIGRADGTARVTGRGLHVDASKRRLAAYLAVGNRIHRAAAGERKVAQPGVPLQFSDEMKERLFVHRLHRARDVTVTILQRVAGPPPRPEKLLERRRE